MKARLELVFYLPYRLPRESNSWHSEIIFTELDGLKVGVVVMPLGTADTAPKSIEGLAVQTVSTDGTQIKDDFSQSQPMLNKYSRFYEALAAVSIGDLSGDVPSVQERQKFINAAIAAASRFIQLCKVLSRDELLFFNVPPVSAPHFHVESFPYSEGWFDDSSDLMLNASGLNQTYSKSVGLRHGMNPIPWEAIRVAYQSAEPPRIDMLLLLEARSAHANADERKAVLFAAMAAEVSAFVLAEHKLADKKFLKQLYGISSLMYSLRLWVFSH